MVSDKKQTLVLVAVSMVIVGAIIVGVSFGMPKVYENKNSTKVTANSETETSSSSTDFAQLNNDENYYLSENTTENVATNPTSSNSGENSVSFPLNLNNCTSEELMQINGIGETRANAIISYREYLGGYTDVSQIKEIKGIGDGVYEKIAPYLTV